MTATSCQPIPLLDLDLIERREREIAARHGIDYDTVDRVWVRSEARRELVAEAPCVRIDANEQWSPAS